MDSIHRYKELQWVQGNQENVLVNLATTCSRQSIETERQGIEFTVYYNAVFTMDNYGPYERNLMTVKNLY